MATQLKPVASGLGFVEGPRWHEGRLWFSDFFTSEFVLVRKGGEVLETIATPDRWAVSCALGDDGTTLWCATVAETLEEYRMGGGRGAIEMCRLVGS